MEMCLKKIVNLETKIEIWLKILIRLVKLEEKHWENKNFPLSLKV